MGKRKIQTVLAEPHIYIIFNRSTQVEDEHIHNEVLAFCLAITY